MKLRKRLCSLLIGCVMVMTLLTGCRFNIDVKPSDDGSVDIKVEEQNSESVNITTEEKEIATTEEATEVVQEDNDTTTEVVEDSTEVTETEPANSSSSAMGNYDCDYISKTGVGFKCAEPLTATVDTETYACYEWNRDDSLFEITIESSDAFSMSELIDINKETYSNADGSNIREEYETTLSGDDCWIMVTTSEDSQLATCIIIIDAGSSVKEIKCAMDSTDGATLFKEISSTIVYLK